MEGEGSRGGREEDQRHRQHSEAREIGLFPHLSPRFKVKKEEEGGGKINPVEPKKSNGRICKKQGGVAEGGMVEKHDNEVVECTSPCFRVIACYVVFNI